MSLGRLCQLFGITRQAYYQHHWYLTDRHFEQELILGQVLRIRKSHPRMGTRKLYELLEPFMLEHQIKMGRDALFDLLAAHRLLVRRRKRRFSTTNSSHWLKKYPNLIRGFTPNRSNQLWVSDITYWKVNGKYLYINLITDAYSHKVVGYHLAQTLESIESIQALRMALKSVQGSNKELIHHSDRGVQYCSSGYVKLLQDNDVRISMTENGDPLENPIAERINGILKGEYLETYSVTSYAEAKVVLDEAIRLYNEERPHMSIGNHKPSQLHEHNMTTAKLWKNYYSKNVDENLLQD